MRKVQPYWSTMADDLEVWHDIDECPDAERIPANRIHSADKPPKGRRHCTVCLLISL